jgi:hypothetical protein
MKQLVTLIAAVAAIFFFWHHPAIYPLKVLVVFFHESSHALVTVLTGGEVAELVVNRNQGGHVLSRGGNRFLVLTAGYLGSLAWGVLIYLVAARTRKDALAMSLLGCLIIAIALFFVRNLFGFAFSAAAGVAMILLGTRAGEKVNDFILQLIGLTSMVYVPLDIYSDTISRSHLRSDARMLAEEFGGTTLFWGGLWILASALIIFFSLKWGLKRKNRPEAMDTPPEHPL